MDTIPSSPFIKHRTVRHLGTSRNETLERESDRTRNFRFADCEKNYVTARDYRSYRLTYKSRKGVGTASSHIAKMFKMVKSQVKAHFSQPKDLIFINGFLATCKLACDINSYCK